VSEISPFSSPYFLKPINFSSICGFSFWYISIASVSAAATDADKIYQKLKTQIDDKLKGFKNKVN